jgi:DNA helicase-2/ATP-dependent DNA helicase PcrA
VVIEAPAGCGKTYQGAEYVAETVSQGWSGRILVATHTHAACSVFAKRIVGSGSRLQIRTIDSVICDIASAYHVGLDLPADVGGWARQTPDGYAAVASKVANLVARYPMIGRALAARFPIVVCDEHQDSSAHQHALVAAMHEQGAQVRLFADPMQRIFREKSGATADSSDPWDNLKAQADEFAELDFPHRWNGGCPELGKWVLAARQALKAGGQVDIRSAPASVTVVVAEDISERTMDYRLGSDDRRPIDQFQRQETSLLVLTRYNDTALSLRSFFNRSISLWEGYTRDALEILADSLKGSATPKAIAAAMVAFVGKLGIGFTPSAFGDRLVKEAQERCSSRTRGKPALIQSLATLIIDQPDHRGLAAALAHLKHLVETEEPFAGIMIDCPTEFRDAMRLGGYESAEAALAEMANRRSYVRPYPPDRAISTIHKAKGLECDSVILVPCDARTFPDKPESRCLLYVALSRACKRLMLVVSRKSPSPLLRF